MQRFAANIGWLALIGFLLVLFGTFQAESASTSASAHAFYASCNDLQADGDQTSVTLAPGVAEFQAPIVCETPMVSTHVWAVSLSGGRLVYRTHITTPPPKKALRLSRYPVARG